MKIQISLKSLLLGIVVLVLAGCEGSKGKISLDDIRKQAIYDARNECRVDEIYRIKGERWTFIDSDTLAELNISKGDEIIGGCLYKQPLIWANVISLTAPAKDFKQENLRKKYREGCKNAVGEELKPKVVSVIKSKKTGEILIPQVVGLIALAVADKNNELVRNEDYVRVGKIHSTEYEELGGNNQFCNKLYVYTIKKR